MDECPVFAGIVLVGRMITDVGSPARLKCWRSRRWGTARSMDAFAIFGTMLKGRVVEVDQAWSLRRPPPFVAFFPFPAPNSHIRTRRRTGHTTHLRTYTRPRKIPTASPASHRAREPTHSHSSSTSRPWCCWARARVHLGPSGSFSLQQDCISGLLVTWLDKAYGSRRVNQYPSSASSPPTEPSSPSPPEK